MGEAVGVVVDPDEHRDVEVVTRENLRRHQDGQMLHVRVPVQMLLDLVDVEGRHPRIGVDDGYEHFARGDALPDEEGFHVFHAPGHVGGLSPVLVLSQLVAGVLHQPEAVPEAADDGRRLLFAALFMSLHCHED